MSITPHEICPVPLNTLMLIRASRFFGQHADNIRLEHIMTLLEILIRSVEGLRVDLKTARQQDKW